MLRERRPDSSSKPPLARSLDRAPARLRIIVTEDCGRRRSIHIAGFELSAGEHSDVLNVQEQIAQSIATKRSAQRRACAGCRPWMKKRTGRFNVSAGCSGSGLALRES